MATTTDINAIKNDTSHGYPLPNDILRCVLEGLNLSHLRSAAGVSRQFYDAAWKSGLYIHRDKFFILEPSGLNLDIIDGEVAIWNGLVDHALRKDLRVAFTLVGTGYGHLLPTTGESPLQRLMGPITRALPILVSLSINVGGLGHPGIYAALRDPAPYLRSLCLRSGPYGDEPPSAVVPSSGLFSGQAPLLRELGLDCRSLGSEPIEVFAKVVRFSMWHCEKVPHVSLALHFPRLRHLMVSSNDGQHLVPRPQIDLSGITLQSLVFEDATPKRGPPVPLSLTIPNVPVFHYRLDNEDSMVWRKPHGWRDGTARQIEMHISSRRGLERNIRHAAPDGAWRCSYFFTLLINPTALCGLPGESTRLVFLRLDYELLGELLRCPAEFTALRRLRLDVCVDGDEDYRRWRAPWTVRILHRVRPDDADVQVACPVLASLAILWLGRPPVCPVTLDSAGVAALGRALRPGDRPALELGDVAAGRPFALSDGTTVQDVFASVRRVPCAVGIILDQFDGDVWDDNAAVEADRYLNQSLAW